MQAHLSTLTFDPDGAVTIDLLPSTEANTLRRRVNRIATLDGGAVVNDFGYSEADRTITLRWRPSSAAHEASIARLLRLYSRLHVSTADGVFLVAPESYEPRAEESLMVLLSLEKVSD